MSPPVKGNAIHFCLLLVGLMMSGCAGSPDKVSVGSTPVVNASREVAEQELLDVGIEILETDSESEEAPNSSAISSAESRFIAVHLKRTMQRTGNWGAVRVIPAPTSAVDVLIRGQVEQSDGETLRISIDVYDASGQSWFQKAYLMRVEEETYDRVEQDQQEAFQDLYNAVANDLVRHMEGLSPEELRTIRRVSELRFAADLAPQSLGGYLVETDEGVYRINRLPARDEPMLARVNQIREREYMLIDTVNAYYDNLYEDLRVPYDDWRKYRIQEAEAQRQVERKALYRKLMGAAAILGAIAVEALGGNSGTATLRNVMVIGGAVAVKSGFDISKQAEIHEGAIRELDESFEAEVTPMVVEVEGETVELTGSAETQYRQWRQLLHRIYLTETGLGTIDDDDATLPDAGSSALDPAQP
jgi:hypothetical protein